MPFERDERIVRTVDWFTVMIYSALVLWGWLNVFAAVYDPEANQNIFDFGLNSGRQLAWIGTSVVLIIFIMVIDYRFWESFAFFIYGAMILLLLAVLVAGKEVSGSRSWIEIGPVAIQPAEFAKFATALAMAAYLSKPNIKLDKWKDLFFTASFFVGPPLIIILQNETGSALVFSAFLLVLYREGMNPLPIVLGFVMVALLILALLIDKYILVYSFVVLAIVAIGLFWYNGRRAWTKTWVTILFTLFCTAVTFSVDYFISNILQPHQQNRIKALISPEADPLGYGWNVTQSKIAIGSGGIIGKGFLQGTQTKFDFVPEQHTDFIFCTIGEEYGWVGSLVLISLFITLFFRLLYLAERQRMRFARVYGYSVVGIMFFHFTINIGMTIGLFPVIGIPLPFFSYGGSSLWSFTILLFIFLNLDANRRQVL